MEKHDKYRSTYQPNTLYWGLGIEHEVYLELGTQNVPKQYVLTNHNPERYSHDYIRQSYKPGVYEAAVIEWIQQQQQQGNVHGRPFPPPSSAQGQKHVDCSMVVPLLMKSHSFFKTDVHNEHQTVFSKTTPPNPKFSGQTLLDSLQAVDPYFVETMGKEWVFDGDTIEFNTLGFFNTTLDGVLDELVTTEQTFVQHLNAALAAIPDKHPCLSSEIQIMRKNHAFAMYLTNLSNVNMFNNGTLHFNLTLPTQLDASCNIVNVDEFVQQHKRAIHAIQWLEPLIVAVYGSPDPFAALDQMPHCFSKASQRCAVSRYIGLGTYDTDTMVTGKCNTIPSPREQRWFPLTYLKLPEMGLDINFRKHHNHGIELRCLDHMEDSASMREVWILLIHLMDLVLESQTGFGTKPTENPVWVELTRQCMVHGPTYVLTKHQMRTLQDVWSIGKGKDVRTILLECKRQWTLRFHRMETRNGGWWLIPVGGFSKYVLEPRLLDPAKDAELIRNMLVEAMAAPCLSQCCRLN